MIAAARIDDSEAREAVPLLAGREPVNGSAAAYLCENFACRLPVSAATDLAEQLDQA